MLIEKQSGFFSSLKSVKNRLCSNIGKQDRLGHVIRNKRKVTRSLVGKFTFYLVFKNLDHGEKNPTKCVIMQVSMLGRVRNSHYSSFYLFFSLSQKIQRIEWMKIVMTHHLDIKIFQCCDTTTNNNWESAKTIRVFWMQTSQSKKFDKFDQPIVFSASRVKDHIWQQLFYLPVLVSLHKRRQIKRKAKKQITKG